jgi:hypothetical protein
VVSDIELFVSAQVTGLSSIEGFNGEFRASVKTVLRARAEGTFLWVGFAMYELLKKKTCTEIQKALEGLPPGLPQIYTRMLQRILDEEKTTSCAILRWMTMAQRPLKLLELAAAITIKARHPLIRIEQAVRDAVSYCEPLLQIQHEEVQFVHQSAQDYISQNDPSADAPPWPFRITPKEAHSEIAKTCLDCITKSGFKCGPLILDARNERFPSHESDLLAYAVFHSPKHAQRCSTLDAELLRNLENFFEMTYAVRRNWWEAYRSKNCRHLPTILPLLHMLCYFEFEPLVQRILDCNRWGLRPLKRVDSRDNDGNTALLLVAYEGKEAMVQLLVDKGADIEARNKDGETALHVAAWRWGKATDEYWEERQQTAAREKRKEMVWFLINKGANIEARNKHEETVLRIAANIGDIDMMQLLLDIGANIEERDKCGRTALVYAAQMRDEDVMLVLMEIADINAKSTLACIIGFRFLQLSPF